MQEEAIAPQQVPLLPAGWTAQKLPDGGMRIPRSGRAKVGCLHVLAAGVLSISVLSLSATLVSLFAGGGWLTLLPAGVAVPPAVVGLILAQLAGPVDLTQVEWRLDRNRFLLVRRFWYWERVSFIQDATLHIVPNGGRTRSSRSLELRWEGRRETLLSDFPWRQRELEEAGALVSYHTQWPLIRE